jgi:hypothetical protein
MIWGMKINERIAPWCICSANFDKPASFFQPAISRFIPGIITNFVKISRILVAGPHASGYREPHLIHVSGGLRPDPAPGAEIKRPVEIFAPRMIEKIEMGVRGPPFSLSRSVISFDSEGERR